MKNKSVKSSSYTPEESFFRATIPSVQTIVTAQQNRTLFEKVIAQTDIKPFTNRGL